MVKACSLTLIGSWQLTAYQRPESRCRSVVVKSEHGTFIWVNVASRKLAESWGEPLRFRSGEDSTRSEAGESLTTCPFHAPSTGGTESLTGTQAEVAHYVHIQSSPLVCQNDVIDFCC
ncbi:hypothetical protein J6590_019706 [Homalodisca vitripennis]|nr:hypothetical protein J6590_019706 [Homalodisca vitripennis]